MAAEKSPGRPTTRRYTDAEKAQAVRLVRQLRAELGTDHGTVFRVASQLGFGVESVRSWVRRADIDEGLSVGTTTADGAKIKELEQESRELRYLRLMARSRSIDWLRAEASRQRRELNEGGFPRVGLSAVDDGLLVSETAEEVRRAVAKLPLAEQVVIELAYLRGMTYRAVAAHLDLPEGTVKSRIRSGLRRLRIDEVLENSFDERKLRVETTLGVAGPLCDTAAAE